MSTNWLGASYFPSQSLSYSLLNIAGLIKDKWFQTHSASLKLHTVCLVPKFSGVWVSRSTSYSPQLPFEVSAEHLNSHLLARTIYIYFTARFSPHLITKVFFYQFDARRNGEKATAKPIFSERQATACMQRGQMVPQIQIQNKKKIFQIQQL